MKKLSFFAIAFLFFASSTALGDTLQLLNVWNYGSGGAVSHGVYIGPYKFKYTDAITNISEELWLICDDYDHTVSFNQTWNVNHPFITSGGVDGQIGWLGGELFQYAALKDANTSAAIQYAIWYLSSVDPGGVKDVFGAGGWGTGTHTDTRFMPAYWLTQSQGQNEPIIDYDKSPGGPGQDQFGLDPVPAPEPPSLMLLGTSLFSLGLVLRKKKLQPSRSVSDDSIFSAPSKKAIGG